MTVNRTLTPAQAARMIRREAIAECLRVAEHAADRSYSAEVVRRAIQEHLDREPGP